VQDVDLDRLALVIRNGKGNKDRQTLLSPKLVEPLREQITTALAVLKEDNQRGVGPSLPYALGKKYPNAFRSPRWAYIFPSSTLCPHPVTGELCRHHFHPTVVRKALGIAVKSAGIFNKKINRHTFRHSFA
jgi:integrase